MKNRGFTLLELLGVIVILALLTTLVFPSVLNAIKKSSDKTDKLSMDLISNAADLYIENHANDFKKRNGSKYIIDINELIEDGNLSSNIKISDIDNIEEKCVQVTYNNKFNYELKDKGTCEYFLALPEEYQQLEYIKSTGTQYIDIKYTYEINDEINMSFMKDNDTGAIQGIFGNGNLAPYIGTGLYINASNILTVTIGGTLGLQYYRYETPIQNNVIYNIKYKEDKVYLNEKIIITVNNDLKNGTQDDFSLFRRWGTNGMVGKIYSFNIIRNKKELFTFIPCYRKSDGVIGMYDLVEDKFYTNSGTGTFEKGKDI